MQSLAVQKKTFITFFLVFIGIFTYAYYPTILDLWTRWNQFDESYSHGILVLGISAFYLLSQIKSAPTLAFKPAWLGILLLLGSSILWMLAYFASIEAIQQILLPWTLWLLCYSYLGWKTSKQFIFPIGFLYFAIPIWDVFIVPLQYITTDINGYLLAMVGVEAHIEDVFVTLAVGKFEIAGGCSGLRYLIISITLTSLYSYLNFKRVKSTVTLILIGILLALLANWIRVFIIILAGHFTHMEHSLINEHDHFGWFVFAFTLLPLFYIANKLERDVDDSSDEDIHSEDNQNESLNTNTDELEAHGERHSHVSTLTAFTFTCAVLVTTFIAPLYATDTLSKQTTQLNTIQLTVPAALGDWKRSYLKRSLIKPPSFRSPDAKVDAIYSLGDNHIQLSIRQYIQQVPGKELINFNNRLYNTDDYITTNSGRLNTPNQDVGYIVIKAKNGRRELISFQYHVSYITTSNRIAGKLLDIVRPLIGSPASSLTYTRIACAADCINERKATTEFISTNHSKISHLIEYMAQPVVK